MSNRLFGVLCVLLSFGWAAHGEPTLDPYEVRSANGRFVLSVKPSNMSGAGSATYAMTDAGKPLWSAKLAFTLWRAAVTDDGTTCGFAYNNGHEGWGLGRRDDESALLCVLIDEKGAVRTQDAHPRKHSGVMSNPPSPYEPLALGLTLDGPGDRFVVRVDGTFNKSSIRWWPYRISTGEALKEIVPDQPNSGAFRKEMAADLIPGTPLVLIHWYIYQRGARFAVLNAEGKQVWALEQAEEYAGLGEKFNWWWDVVEPGIRQTAVREKSFDVVSYSLHSRMTYQVEPDAAVAGGFTIKEVKRVEEVPAPSGANTANLEEIALEAVGTIELEAPAPTSPIDNIHDFNIDAKGRLGFVRANYKESPRFLLVNPDGSIALELALSLPSHDKAQAPAAAPVSGDRWILARSFYEKAGPTAAWWLDIDTRSQTPIDGFTAGEVRALRGVAGGGFAIEGNYRESDAVTVFDATGKPRARIGEISRAMMQSAAVRTDGSIAVLTGVANTIEVYNKEGTFVRSESLADLLGGRPNYPATVRADRDGGLILEDFQGSPPIYRLKADGTVLSKFTPKFPDGRVFRVMGGVQCAPDGTLWTSDGHSFLRLDENGVVDRTLGPAPASDELTRVNALEVGTDGRIYAIDARSSAVHIFDQSGKRVRICQPAATDFPSDQGVGQIAVAHDQSVWIHARMPGAFGASKYYGFGADGGRLEPKRCKLDQITETWLFQPKAGKRWVLGYEKVWLVDEKDEVAKTISHRPSGAWLGHVNDGAVAPDGSLAVVAGPRGMGMRGPAELNIYSPDGEPIKTISLPDKWIGMRVAFTGRWAITADDKELHLYEVQTGKRARFVIPAEGAEKHYWYPHVSPDAREVWLYDAGGKALQRFKLPA